MSPQIENWQRAWLASRDDPYMFATGVLGIPEPGSPPAGDLHAMEPWQANVFKAIRDGNKRISIRSGHGCKKSATLSILVIWGLLTHRNAKIPVVAGAQSQLSDTIWPEIAVWCRRLPPALQDEIDVQKERVVVVRHPDEAFAVARTASKDNPQAMAGFHSPFLMFLVDEASSVHEAAYEVAMGALSTPGALAVLAGNPTKSSGFFFDTHHLLRERWFCMHVSSEDVPTARGHIDDIIARYGRNSNAYRVRVEGNFPTQDDETVIPLDLVLASKGRQIATSNVWPVWGLDVARFGDDSTALIKRQGNTLLGIPMEWHGLDGAQVSGKVIDQYMRTPIDERPREIVVDIIGYGASAYDIMRLPGSPVAQIVRGCNVSESAAISDTDHRLRDELWFRGRAWFAAKDCKLPNILIAEDGHAMIEKLIAELTAPTYDFTSLGKRKVESKDDMKKRGVHSPNLADAFLLSLAAGIHPRSNPHHRVSEPAKGSWMTA
ncbi:MAG: hypothetical protein Q7T86_03195 [Hyphomicrobiaceae bacterium]|nr:hypothetical protein [Hyphomicrobiaceae bacterium]